VLRSLGVELALREDPRDAALRADYARLLDVVERIARHEGARIHDGQLGRHLDEVTREEAIESLVGGGGGGDDDAPAAQREPALIDDLANRPRAEAEAVARRLSEEGPARAAAFARAVAEQGGPQLDYSYEGLVPLWVWVTERVAPPKRRLFRRPRAPQLPAGERPFWLEGEDRLPDDVAALAGGITAYLGEVVRRALPDADWFTWAESEAVDGYHQPVLGTRERERGVARNVRNALFLLRREGARPDDEHFLQQLVFSQLGRRRPRKAHQRPRRS
jgi:hypothetical protein